MLRTPLPCKQLLTDSIVILISYDLYTTESISKANAYSTSNISVLPTHDITGLAPHGLTLRSKA